MDKQKEHYSRNRQAILGVLQDTDVHPTAEWVYNRLKPHYPHLSRGTVYRNLNHLLETGQAVSLGVINGYERFDGDTTPHAHLVCRRCGAVADVQIDLTDQDLLDKLSQETGCKLEGVRVRFSGLCPDCAQEL